MAYADATIALEPFVPHPAVESLARGGYTEQMQIGDWGESIARNEYRLRSKAWEVVPGNRTANGNGLDFLAIRRDATGAIVEIDYGEVKARKLLRQSDLDQAAQQLTDEALARKLALFERTDPDLVAEVSRFMDAKPERCKRVIVGIDGATGKRVRLVRKGAEFVNEGVDNIGRTLRRAAERADDAAVRRSANRLLDMEQTIVEHCRGGSRVTELAGRVPERFEAPAVPRRAGTPTTRRGGGEAKRAADRVAGTLDDASGRLSRSADRIVDETVEKAARSTGEVAETLAHAVAHNADDLAKSGTKLAGTPALKMLGKVAGPASALVEVGMAAYEVHSIEARHRRGEITDDVRDLEQGKATAGAVGGAGCALGGAAGGAAIGTVVGGPFGTAVGGIVGGIGGAIGGDAAVRAAAGACKDRTRALGRFASRGVERAGKAIESGWGTVRRGLGL